MPVEICQEIGRRHLSYRRSGHNNRVRIPAGQLQALRPEDWKGGALDDDIATESQFVAAERTAGRQFTPNTVALQLRDPSLFELSIYVLRDLCSNPLFVTDQKGPDMARTFAAENISRKGTKALLSMSTFQSIPNSTAFAAVRMIMSPYNVEVAKLTNHRRCFAFKSEYCPILADIRTVDTAMDAHHKPCHPRPDTFQERRVHEGPSVA